MEKNITIVINPEKLADPWMEIDPDIGPRRDILGIASSDGEAFCVDSGVGSEFDSEVDSESDSGVVSELDSGLDFDTLDAGLFSGDGGS
jgi:hypothetical protein